MSAPNTIPKRPQRQGTCERSVWTLILSDVIRIEFKCRPYTEFDTRRLDYSVEDVGAESLSRAVTKSRTVPSTPLRLQSLKTSKSLLILSLVISLFAIID